MKPLHLFIQHKRFMQQEGVVAKLGPLHTYIIQAGREYFQDIKEEALLVARQRWEASTNNVKNREPFGYKNFKAVVARLNRYNNMVLGMAPTWIGCRYRCPIIWYYDYDLRDYHINQDFVILKTKKWF